MDVLKPKFVWVEDRCYRFPDNTVWSSKQINTPYEEEYDQMEDDTNQEVNNTDCNIVIETRKDGKYQHSATIPQVFHRFLIGTRGSIKKDLENETKTTIKIPYLGSEDEKIVILGRNRASVISCRQRIDLIVESSRKKLSFTHFVSIPLSSEIISNNFIKFRDEILNDSELMSNGLSEEYFVNPNKLHLTIGMLLLVDDKEKKEAIETLDACIKNIQPILEKNGPVSIKIQGVEIMNDDVEKVKVLFGKVLKNDTLQDIANKIQNFFVDKGLMDIQFTETVKLHMTLMKTSLAKDKSNKKNPKLAHFDGSKILKKYKDYHFGETKLEKINISIRNTINKDGNYGTLTEINLLK